MDDERVTWCLSGAGLLHACTCTSNLGVQAHTQELMGEQFVQITRQSRVRLFGWLIKPTSWTLLLCTVFKYWVRVMRSLAENFVMLLVSGMSVLMSD